MVLDTPTFAIGVTLSDTLLETGGDKTASDSIVGKKTVPIFGYFEKINLAKVK